MTDDPWVVFAGLFLLFATILPLGLVILRVVDRLRGTRLGLTPLERLLVAPYCSVVLLFIVACVPAPFYTLPVVLTILGAGVVCLAVLWVREHGRTLASSLRWASGPISLAVLVGTVGLVLLEVVAVGAVGFPNAYDGSYQSTYVLLLVTNHTAPWTLNPYANVGVVYPLGAAVWMSLPNLLLGWTILSGPVALPPFFLGLSPAAAFCLGHRLGGGGTPRGRQWGLIFAAFFGLVASWPRLFIGGSYDFAFGLPLFLVSLAWLRPAAEAFGRNWKDTAIFGAFLGVLTSLSLALGEAVVILLLAAMIAYRPRPPIPAVRRRLAHFFAGLAIGAVFVARSIAGVAIWYRYPAHVLSDTGNPPYAPMSGLPSPSLGTFQGNLDPFVPFKWKMSPLPALSVELQALLAVGVVLCALVAVGHPRRLRTVIGADLVTPVVVGTLVMFLWTALLIAGSGLASLSSIFDFLASLYESSFLLFIFYQLIGLVPLVALWELVRERSRAGAKPVPPVTSVRTARRPRPAWSRSARPIPPLVGLGILLVVPFAVGVATLPTAVPGFLSSHLNEFANVTGSDVDALEWAGTHLPSCSTVLGAPGSAALFLPLYARLHVDFPMMPISDNLSYNTVVTNLSSGVYTESTRQALQELGVTEVFVTGQTSETYAALVPQPLASSGDFSLLFHEGDAYLFAFSPVVSSTGCAPT